jgi:hypothetical protein
LESDRFLILIGGMLAADMIGDLAVSLQAIDKKAKTNAAGWLLSGLAFFGFLWGQANARISQIEPSLTSSLEQAAVWLRDETEPDKNYLFFSASHDAAEWLPYLTQRAPAVGHWGAGGQHIPKPLQRMEAVERMRQPGSSRLSQANLETNPANYILTPAASEPEWHVL